MTKATDRASVETRSTRCSAKRHRHMRPALRRKLARQGARRPERRRALRTRSDEDAILGTRPRSVQAASRRTFSSAHFEVFLSPCSLSHYSPTRCTAASFERRASEVEHPAAWHGPRSGASERAAMRARAESERAAADDWPRPVKPIHRKPRFNSSSNGSNKNERGRSVDGGGVSFWEGKEARAWPRIRSP